MASRKTGGVPHRARDDAFDEEPDGRVGFGPVRTLPLEGLSPTRPR